MKITTTSLKKHKLLPLNPVRIKPLIIPEGVLCTFREWQVEITGPLGTLYLDNYHVRRVHHPSEPNKLITTYNTMVQNAIDGVAYGHLLKLKVRGPGYKVVFCKQHQLILRLGYSHLCHIKIPQHVKVSFNKHNQIFCYGISKTELSAFATRLKRLRRPSPYHAKGVFTVGEIVVNKLPGKAGRKSSK